MVKRVRDDACYADQRMAHLRASTGMLRLRKRAVSAVLLIVILAFSVALLDRSPNLWSITEDRVTKVAVAARVFRIRYGYWPTNLEQMVRSEMLGVMDTNDGWGRPLIYARYDPLLMRGTVTSYGADGKPGGVGPSADTQATFW